MWDLRVVNPFGSLSIRKTLLFVATMIVAVFAYIFATAPTAYAADATWNGSSITYNGNQYTQLADAEPGDGTNLPDGSQLYGYIDDSQTAHIISFPPGDDLTDVTTATYSEYDFTPPNTYTNRSNVQQISIDPQTAANQGTSSCDSTFTVGIGWIVCPVTNFLAGAMDWLFEILTGFLTVRPAQTSQDNALYRAWTFMRNFANVAFVIGFLVIIYSQLTSMGISNYGIKRTLPRLILAAILVNVSYWVCAIAIDISNIMGYALQDIFIGMRNSIVGGEGNSWDVVSWESIAGFILSGGTAAVALGVGAHALAAGTVGGALYLLLPILVGVLMAVLVALLIMAARQAIIVVLVILAPLAFVAYLLPNTEKYFDKWRGLFMTMLLVFPMFSILFGGAQLAGIAIIQNADSINLIILGMAVQVAPVVITPFLIKFSGSLLGRIAGMVNNPNRGAIDRTKKFAQERAGQYKDRRLGEVKPRGGGLSRAQKIDTKRREREGWQKAHQTETEARWSKSKGYSNIQQSTMEASQLKEAGEAAAQSRYEAAKKTNPWVQTADLELRSQQQLLENNKSDANINWENLRAGHSDGLVTAQSIANGGLAQHVRANTERSQTLASRLHAAQHVQQQNFAEELERNADLRQQAGGIDPSGALKAEARAMGEISKASQEDVSAGVQLLNYKAVRENTTLKNLSAHMVENAVSGKVTYESGELEAALEAQTIEGAIPILEDARSSKHIDQTMVTRVFSRNVGTLKQKGGFHLQADPTLNIEDKGENNFTKAMNKGRMGSMADTSAAQIKDLKAGWIKSMAQKVAKNEDNIINDANAADLKKTYNNVYEALNNAEVRATIGDRLSEVQTIEYALRSQFGTTDNIPEKGLESASTDYFKDKK
ncbi:MAG TPA: hypothetical protein VFM68_00930 [Candidatus Saccharimonadales bacterium]|nr:hypothetical protein [Candidatus Saccharimonadales bacterium]